jgi:para-nitrobenzyl esterase
MAHFTHRALRGSFILLTLFFATATYALDTDTGAVQVKVKQGELRGTREGGVCVWKGIRYAKAPAGNLRFRAPEPVEAWTGVKDATQFGPIAPQVKNALGGKEVQSEDCLFLNIWSPAADAPKDGIQKKRPVMFWLHGGGFAIGAGSSPLYDGAQMAKTGDVVVVTINYRLGPLGFLYFKDIAGTNPDFDNNLGIKDQIAALHWVHENIASFGGDPNAVTIFGESAGGNSVLTLLAAPSAQGLFSKAISESAAPKLSWTPELATTITKKYLSLLNIPPDSLSKLKQLPVDTLMAAVDKLSEFLASQNSMNRTFAPTIDGQLLPENIYSAIRNRQSLNVPLLIGTNRNEANLFALKRIHMVPTNAEKLEEVFSTVLSKEQIKSITSAYKHYPHKKGVLEVETDLVFRIPAIQYAETQSRYAPTYMYRFDWASFPLKLVGLKSFHGLEIPFVWGNLDAGFAKKLNFMTKKKDVHYLSAQMQQAWLNFAKTGNPNQPGKDDWKKFTATERNTMLFDKKCGATCAPDDKQRKAWEHISY